MELYIVRHGEAGQAMLVRGRADDARELTREGRKETAEVAKALRALGCSPERIGTSPLPRARQTAEILAEALDAEKELESCKFLSPGSDAEALIRWLRDARADSVMIVGHMPDLAQPGLGPARAERLPRHRLQEVRRLLHLVRRNPGGRRGTARVAVAAEAVAQAREAAVISPPRHDGHGGTAVTAMNCLDVRRARSVVVVKVHVVVVALSPLTIRCRFPIMRL